MCYLEFPALQLQMEEEQSAQLKLIAQQKKCGGERLYEALRIFTF